MRSKRITAIILSLVFVLSLIPFGVFAVTSYNLWIGDTEVTSTNLSGEGWSYDPETNTLTLQNLNNDNNYITKQYRYDNMHSFSETTIQDIDTAYAAIAYLGTNEFNIYVDDVAGGSNSFLDVRGEGDRKTGTFGIYSLASLNISGIDRINVNISDDEAQLSCAMYSTGDITVNGNGEHEFLVDSSRENSFGIWAKGNVTLETGWLTAKGSRSDNSKGILANTVTIKDTAERLTAQGSTRAIDATVINGIEGRGWNNYSGTGEKTILPVNKTGASPEYKKIRFYAFEHYGLWVGDTEVVEDNLSGEGWSFNNSSCTLTLNNYKYYGNGHAFIRQNGDDAEENNAQAGITYLGERELEIYLPNGTSSEIAPTNTAGLENSFGIYSAASVTLSGLGELIVNACDNDEGDSIAIASEGNVKFDGSNISCNGGDAENFSFGAFAAGQFIIDGGSNTANGGDSNSMSSAGISASEIYLTNSYLEAKGGEAGVNSNGIIFSDEAHFTSGSAVLEGEDYGISGSFDSELYIGAGISEFSAKGNTLAMGTGFEDWDEYLTFYNEVDGRGWDDPDRPQDYTVIEIGDGIFYDYSYKKVEFHEHDFGEETEADRYFKSNATCTSPKTYYKSCSICGKASDTDTFTVGEANGHDFTAKRTTNEYLVHAATCTEPAEYYFSCKDCDAKDTETFTYGEPNGHSFTAENTDAKYLKGAANCTEAAVYFKSCKDCDLASTTETFNYGEPNGHDAEHHEKVGASTSAEGVIEYWSCTVCDKLFFDENCENEITDQNDLVIPMIPEYKTESSAAIVWVKGSGKDLVFPFNRNFDLESCFDHFAGAKMDGKTLVRDKDYTAKRGSTIITLKAETLEALSSGEHVFTSVFDDAESEITLTIKDAPVSHQTGDNITTVIFIAVIALISGAALIVAKKRVFGR